MNLSENELWLLSFYRTSEISGALFFGRLARSLRPSAIQVDMSKHFADEAQHAWLWTKCIHELGSQPLKLNESYQDQYAGSVGVPANLMEILAITQVFEGRVINQYTQHRRAEGLHPLVYETLDRIMQDERWHIEWVRNALASLEPEYGKDSIAATLRRFREADKSVYEDTMKEHGERVATLSSRK